MSMNPSGEPGLAQAEPERLTLPRSSYPSVLARRIGERFGVLPAVFNGAVGATGSDFFASCWDIRIPTDVDLVVVEVSINDGGKNAFINKDLTQVLRSLMSLPDPPAILLLDVYSPFVAWWYGGSVGVRVLGPYFDVPVIRFGPLPHGLGVDQH